MSPRRSALSATALGVMLLAACVTQPRSTDASRPGPIGTSQNAIDMATDWPARRAALLAQQNFALQGRVGIVAGQEGFSATLRWSQRAQTGEMQLAGPLGVGALKIEFDADSLQVSDSRGVTLSGASARAELERRLGFALPLTQLKFWARGVAAPPTEGIDAAATETLDAAGQHLTALEQDGWRMNYSVYAPSVLGVLPQKLEMVRPGVRIRLAIQKWDPP